MSTISSRKEVIFESAGTTGVSQRDKNFGKNTTPSHVAAIWERMSVFVLAF